MNCLELLKNKSTSIKFTYNDEQGFEKKDWYFNGQIMGYYHFNKNGMFDGVQKKWNKNGELIWYFSYSKEYIRKDLLTPE